MYILPNQATLWKVLALKESQRNGGEYVELDYRIKTSDSGSTMKNRFSS